MSSGSSGLGELLGHSAKSQCKDGFTLGEISFQLLVPGSGMRQSRSCVCPYHTMSGGDMVQPPEVLRADQRVEEQQHS